MRQRNKHVPTIRLKSNCFPSLHFPLRTEAPPQTLAPACWVASPRPGRTWRRCSTRWPGRCRFAWRRSSWPVLCWPTSGVCVRRGGGWRTHIAQSAAPTLTHTEVWGTVVCVWWCVGGCGVTVELESSGVRSVIHKQLCIHIMHNIKKLDIKKLKKKANKSTFAHQTSHQIVLTAFSNYPHRDWS